MSLARSSVHFVVAMAISAVAAFAAADDTKRHAPPYEVAHNAPLEPSESRVSETDDFAQLRVEFNGIKADRVPAFLYLPKGEAAKGDTTKRPAVLLQYGSGGDKKTDYIVAMGKQFVSRGFVVLTIDSVGRGERRKPDQPKGGIGAFLSDAGRDTFLQYCSDYSRAVDYLASRPEVDRERIGYVGISWGAITGVTYVAHDDRIKAMASIVGGGGFLGGNGTKQPASGDPAGNVKNGDDAKNGGNDNKPSNNDAAAKKPPPASFDPVHHVARIAPRPLLLLNATKDQLVPKQFSEALHKAAGEGSRIVWMETDHFFNGVDRSELGVTVINFMDEHLPRKPKP